MKIALTETKKTTREVDVELPIYRHHDCGGDTYDSDRFMRVDAGPDGTLAESGITISDRPGSTETCVEMTFDPRYQFDSSEPDYNLGRGEYACTEERWQQAVSAAREMLAKIAG